MDDLRNSIALVIDASYRTAISKALSTADKILAIPELARPTADLGEGWQPIETATVPANGGMGPVVLVHLNTDQDELRVTVARYWGGWSTVGDDFDIQPTHWMPLPSPPTETQK